MPATAAQPKIVPSQRFPLQPMDGLVTGENAIDQAAGTAKIKPKTVEKNAMPMVLRM